MISLQNQKTLLVEVFNESIDLQKGILENANALYLTTADARSDRQTPEIRTWKVIPPVVVITDIVQAKIF